MWPDITHILVSVSKDLNCNNKKYKRSEGEIVACTNAIESIYE